MKKVLLMLLAVLLALPAMAQTELRQDGLVFKLYTPEDGTPYAEVSGNLLTETKAVTIPLKVRRDDVDYPVTAIGYGAFSECKYLTSVTIGNSVTSIGGNAFGLCSRLTSVTIPSSVTTIGNYAFYWCERLATVTIPNSVTSIGNNAFSHCQCLTSVTIPNSVTTIGGSAFYGCSVLTSVNLPNSMTTIGHFTFAYCYKLTSVTIPSSVTSIGNYAFFDCNLSTLTIPNSVTSIGNYAFSYCIRLTSVTIPVSVNSIGEEAFARCTKLAEVNYETANPISASRVIFEDDTYKSATLNVAKGGLDRARATEPWMYFVNIKEKENSGIEDVMAEFDPTAPVEVYNLNGVKVADTAEGLPAGLYIIRQGKTAKKVAVK